MSLRERKKDKTRTQLLEAALDLIGRQGFAETTINQIAAAVDVSPRTLLRYFPTKEDVIVSWVDETMTIFFDTLTDRPVDEAPHLSLVAAARAMLNAYQQRSEFYLVIEKAITSSSSVSARKQQMSAVLGEKVETYIQERFAGPRYDSLAIELHVAVIFSMIRVSIRRWVASEGKIDLVAVFEQASKIVTLHDAEAIDAQKVARRSSHSVST